ncbi:cytochrome P450 [Microbacteriaceae bacterium VKM Ac-2854]|nr:cytochrome P450 [Microbacteriaceae bacterium VKM Ac-2854]
MTRPTARSPRDESLAFLTSGYLFTGRLWRRVRSGSRSASTHALGSDALFVRGAEGVELFYDQSRIARQGAMPGIFGDPLFGTGSLHGMDGPAHLHRKALFVELAYEDAQVERMRPLFEREWRLELSAWIAGGDRSAYAAAVGAFGRASMTWAGVPGTRAAKTRWSARLAQIVDAFGVPFSPEYLLAKANRLWSDRHAAQLIAAARAGTLAAEEGTALRAWADYRDAQGETLSAHLAGIELQNSIRPMIAVARFVAFAAKRLHERPEWRERIAAETAERGSLVSGPLATAFAQEVRRTAPFVPMLPGRALTDIELDGHRVRAGDRVVLDVAGTNTDPASWQHAAEFDPERFVGVEDYEALAAFVPHGGSDVATGHRCPGEKLSIAGLSAAVAALSDPRVRILGSGLDVNLRRLPTKPASGGRIRAVGAPSRCPVPH